MRWYLGAQNDGLYIIDQPPRPSTDDEVHDRAVNVIAAVTDQRWAQSIIDAHNRSEATKRWADGYCAQCGKAPHEAEDCNACRVQPEKQA